MPSAVLFLPCHIMELMNFVTRSEPYTGIGFHCAFRDVSFSGHLLLAPGSLAVGFEPCQSLPRNIVLCFRAFCSVLGAALFAICYAYCVQCSADYVISDSGEIFYAASANQHDGVLLQIVTDAWNVSRDFDSVGQADAGNFAQCRVRLLWRLRVDAGADSALLRTSLQRRTRRLVSRTLAAIANQLIKSRHSLLLSSRRAYPTSTFKAARMWTRICFFPIKGLDGDSPTILSRRNTAARNLRIFPLTDANDGDAKPRSFK